MQYGVLLGVYLQPVNYISVGAIRHLYSYDAPNSSETTRLITQEIIKNGSHIDLLDTDYILLTSAKSIW